METDDIPEALSDDTPPDGNVAMRAGREDIERWRRIAAQRTGHRGPLADMSGPTFAYVLEIDRRDGGRIRRTGNPGSEAAAALRDALDRIHDAGTPELDPEGYNDPAVRRELEELPDDMLHMLRDRADEDVATLALDGGRFGRGPRTPERRLRHDRLELFARLADETLTGRDPETTPRRTRGFRSGRFLDAVNAAPGETTWTRSDRTRARAETYRRGDFERSPAAEHAPGPTPSGRAPTDAGTLPPAPLTSTARRATNMFRPTAPPNATMRLAAALETAQAAFALRASEPDGGRRRSLWTIDAGIEAVADPGTSPAARINTAQHLVVTRHHLDAPEEGIRDEGAITFRGERALEEIARAGRPAAGGGEDAPSARDGGRPLSLHLLTRGRAAREGMRRNLAELALGAENLPGSVHDPDRIGETPASDPDPRVRDTVDWVKKQLAGDGRSPPHVAAATLAEAARTAKHGGDGAASRILSLPEVAERLDLRRSIAFDSEDRPTVKIQADVAPEAVTELRERLRGNGPSGRAHDPFPAHDVPQPDEEPPPPEEPPETPPLPEETTNAATSPAPEDPQLHAADVPPPHEDTLPDTPPLTTDMHADVDADTDQGKARDDDHDRDHDGTVLERMPGPPLNEAQQRAAHAPTERDVVVLSRAGTGKTHTVAARFAALVDGGTDPSRIGVLAFNRDAAESLRRRLSPAGGSRSASTFHATGFDLLRDGMYAAAGLPRPPGSASVLADGDVLREIAAAAREVREAHGTEPGRPADTAKRIEAWQHRAMPPDEAAAEAQENGGPGASAAALTYAAYQARKRAAGTLDHGDMIMLPATVMRRNEDERRRAAARFDHLLVDEFQDLDDAQKEMVDHLTSGGARLFAVGDDLQAIYGFRHANVRHLVNLTSERPEAEHVVLTENHRNTPEIVAPANRIGRNVAHRVEEGEEGDSDIRATSAPGPRPTAHAFRDRNSEAEAVAEALRTRREAGADPSGAAVLARRNDVLQAIERKLVRDGEPYRAVHASIWERPETRAATAYLRALAENDETDARDAFRGVLGTLSERPGHGRAENAAAAAESAAGGAAGGALLSEAAADALPEHVREEARTTFRVLREGREALSRGADPAGVLRDAMHASGLTERVDADDRADRGGNAARRENVETVLSVAARHADAASALRAVDASAASSATPRDRHGGDGRATLATLHGAKGGEWTDVTFAGFEDGVLPSDSAKDPASLDEERRLAYVGLTRARRTMRVSWSRADGGPSPFLTREIGDLIDRRDDMVADAREAAVREQAAAADAGPGPGDPFHHPHGRGAEHRADAPSGPRETDGSTDPGPVPERGSRTSRGRNRDSAADGAVTTGAGGERNDGRTGGDGKEAPTRRGTRYTTRLFHGQVADMKEHAEDHLDVRIRTRRTDGPGHTLVPMRLHGDNARTLRNLPPDAHLRIKARKGRDDDRWEVRHVKEEVELPPSRIPVQGRDPEM